MALCERCKMFIPKKARRKKAWQWPNGQRVKSPCHYDRLVDEKTWWLKKSGHGIPKGLKADTWHDNPSFSEDAYQQHFGFPSQPGYYEVESGKEVG